MVRRVARKRTTRRCQVCGKWLFTSYNRAARKLRRTTDPGGNVYWSPRCGGWHLSASTPSEVDRRRAEYLQDAGADTGTDPEHSDPDTAERAA